MLSQFSDIGARDKSLITSAGHDHHADAGFFLDVMESGAQVFHRGHVERIEHLWPVDGDVGNRALFLEKNVFKVHKCEPASGVPDSTNPCHSERSEESMQFARRVRYIDPSLRSG